MFNPYFSPARIPQDVRNCNYTNETVTSFGQHSALSYYRDTLSVLQELLKDIEEDSFNLLMIILGGSCHRSSQFEEQCKELRNLPALNEYTPLILIVDPEDDNSTGEQHEVRHLRMGLSSNPECKLNQKLNECIGYFSQKSVVIVDAMQYYYRDTINHTEMLYRIFPNLFNISKLIIETQTFDDQFNERLNERIDKH